MKPEINFSCTMCGQCCHNHNLPLTIDEAIAWLEDGGKVAVLCEASPWPSEPPASDGLAAHIRRRSFAALSGAANIRVTVILVAIISGPCRNLGDDLKCRIYDRRPLICRIYPAEVNPFIALTPTAKACPPEAWQSNVPLLAGGAVVDSETRALIERSRRADTEDAPGKRRLCRDLGIAVAALKGEGFAVHEVDQRRLLDALRASRVAGDSGETGDTRWRVHAPWQTTLDTLRATGLEVVSAKDANETYWFAMAPPMPPAQPVGTVGAPDHANHSA